MKQPFPFFPEPLPPGLLQLVILQENALMPLHVRNDILHSLFPVTESVYTVFPLKTAAGKHTAPISSRNCYDIGLTLHFILNHGCQFQFADHITGRKMIEKMLVFFPFYHLINIFHCIFLIQHGKLMIRTRLDIAVPETLQTHSVHNMI